MVNAMAMPTRSDLKVFWNTIDAEIEFEEKEFKERERLISNYEIKIRPRLIVDTGYDIMFMEDLL